MVDPVSGRIPGEGKVTYGISVKFVVELEKDTETGVCKDGMRRSEGNVVVGKMLFSLRESFRCQVLLDGEMRELNYLVASPIDDCDETRTYGDQHFSRVFWPPIRVKCRRGCLVELNCKDFR